MNPYRYILRRLLFGILVLICVVTITFTLSRSLGGNTVAAWLGKSASMHPELAELYAEKYHLQDPIPVQFYYYVINLLEGNLGFSPSRGFAPVITVIATTLPFTLQIALFAFLISIILGVLLGVLSAKYQHRKADIFIRAFYLAGYSSPPFFVALILLILFVAMLACNRITEQDKIVGIKIYEYEGDYNKLASRWNDMGINTAFVSIKLASDSAFRHVLKKNNTSAFLS